MKIEAKKINENLLRDYCKEFLHPLKYESLTQAQKELIVTDFSYGFFCAKKAIYKVVEGMRILCDRLNKIFTDNLGDKNGRFKRSSRQD